MPRHFCYIDTSSFMNAIHGIGNSRLRALDAVYQGFELVASDLLEVEARRVKVFKELHEHVVIDNAKFEQELRTVNLVALEAADTVLAGSYRFHVKSLDALHLATAQRIGCSTLLTDDVKRASSMKQVAEQQLGMTVL